MRHDIESCDHGGEDQDMTWLDGPVSSVKGKLSDDLASMDRSNIEEQVKSRSMNQYDHVMIWSGSYHLLIMLVHVLHQHWRRWNEMCKAKV
jgi:hypothetical protein